MIKIYGMPSCPDCSFVERQAEGREGYEVIDIGSHVRLLKEFLRLRDSSPVFDDARRHGRAGIPCFVLDDGTGAMAAPASPASCSTTAGSRWCPKKRG